MNTISPRPVLILAILTSFATFGSLVVTADAQDLEWIRQSGTTEIEQSYGVSADKIGNVYISGRTTGSLGGPNSGGYDVFLSKYDASGVPQWTRQFGTSAGDNSFGVSVDGLGNVFVAGSTAGSLGSPSAGKEDVFLAKYDASGSFQWIQQFGTSAVDQSLGVSVDGLGNVYVAGETRGDLGGPSAGDNDAFVSKFNQAGALQWTRQFGTAAHDFASSVSADGLGSIYVSGMTSGSLSGPNIGSNDAFVTKLDADGNFQWTQQFGTIDVEAGYSVSADGQGNVFVSGSTDGDMDNPNVGLADAFVSKFDENGQLHWTRQLGTAADDGSRSVSSDGLGNVFVSGWTTGSLAQLFADSRDAFIAKYDGSGDLRWVRQIANSGDEGPEGVESYGVSADGLGSVYVTGWTAGILGGPNFGTQDAYVAKYGSVPEPSTGLILLLTLPGIAWARCSGTFTRRCTRCWAGFQV